MLSEGQIDLTAAGLIAAANYLGYLLGAVDAMFAHRPQQVQRRLHGGLWLCVLLTLASSDGVTIAGEYFEASSRPAPAVLLVHTDACVWQASTVEASVDVTSRVAMASNKRIRELPVM